MPISAFTDIADCVTVIDSTMDTFTDAGATPATATGDIVQQINDQSGAGHHWTNTGASGERPKILSPDPHLGVRVLEFDATAPAEFLDVPNFLNAFTAACVFWVLRPRRWPPLDNQHSGFHSFNASTEYSLFPYQGDGNVYDNWGSTNHRPAITGQRQTATWHKHYMESNNAGFHAGGTDGQRDAGKSLTSTFGFDTTPKFGKTRDNFGFDGFFRLCVMYGRILSDAEYADVNELIDTVYFPPEIYFAQVHQDKLPNAGDFQGGLADFAHAVHPVFGVTRDAGTAAFPILG